VSYKERELNLRKWRRQRKRNRESNKKRKEINDKDFINNIRTLRLNTIFKVGKNRSFKEDKKGQGFN
jgi:hypothetical protein